MVGTSRLLFLSLVFGLSRPVGAQETPDPLGLLEALVRPQGVSGHEGPVREVIRAHLPPGVSPEVDEVGNLLVRLGTGRPHVVLIAHLDEIGYEVTGIDQDGRLQVRARGGFFRELFEGHPVVIVTGRGPVPAVVAPSSWKGELHEGQADLGGDEMVRVDVGTTSSAETGVLGIAVGDPLTVPKRFTRLGVHRAAMRSADDRMGCAALVLALYHLGQRRPSRPVHFVWSVEEEVGLLGARAVARRTETDLVLAVDTFVTSDSPIEETRFALARLGAGPAVRAIDRSNIAPRGLVFRVLDLARAAGLPLQYGVTGGGNDGSVFIEYGAMDLPLGYPIRYSHSAVETVDGRDLDVLGRLLARLVLEL